MLKIRQKIGSFSFFARFLNVEKSLKILLKMHKKIQTFPNAVKKQKCVQKVNVIY